jgi:hypothetical protein
MASWAMYSQVRSARYRHGSNYQQQRYIHGNSNSKYDGRLSENDLPESVFETHDRPLLEVLREAIAKPPELL